MSSQNNQNFRVRPSSKLAQKKQLRSGSGSQQNLDRQLYGLETNSRINEIQSTLINLRNNIDIKLSRIVDPRAEFKALLDKQGNYTRQLAMKVNQLQQAIYHSRQASRRNQQIVSATLLQLQKRLEVAEYKVKAAQKQLQGNANIRNILAVPALPAPISQPSGSTIQLRLLRQMFSQQKKSRQSLQASIQRQHQLLSEKSLQLERQMYQILSKQQQQQMKMMQQKKQEESETQKARRQQQGNEITAVKGMIGSVEKKLSGQIQTKLRNENELKIYIDSRVDRIKEELLLQQKAVIGNQTAFMKQSKQSIESVYGLVIASKKQLEQGLTATQSLTADNIKNLSKAIDTVRQTLTRRLQSFVGSNQDTGNRYAELKAKIVESLALMDERMKQLEQRNMQAEQRMDKQNTAAFEEIIKKLQDQQILTNSWKSEVERKNLAIFKEISGTLKILKSEAAKERQQSLTRDSQRQKQIQTQQKSLSSQLKKHIQGVINVFNNEFEVVVSQLQILVEMINVSRTESDKAAVAKIQQSMDIMRQEFTATANSKIQEQALIIQKNISKASQSLINRLMKQSSYLNQLISQKQSILATQVGILTSEVKQLQLKTEQQLSNSANKYQQFTAQYKEDLAALQASEAKQRSKFQQQLTKNTQSSLDVSNKRNEFVIEGIRKAIEMNAQKDKLELMNSIQTLKNETIRQANNLQYELTSNFNEKIQKQTTQRIQQQMNILENLRSLETSIKQHIMTETNNTKIYIQEQLRSVSNRIDQYTAEISLKVSSINDNIDESVKKMETQRYVDYMTIHTVLDEINESLAAMLQQAQQFSHQLSKLKDLPKEVDSVQQQLYVIDEKINKAIHAHKDLEAVVTTTTNQMYLDHGYAKAQAEELHKSLSDVMQLIETLNGKILDNERELEDTDQRFTDNFKVVEKAIRHTNEFLNTLDTRLTLEEIYSNLADEEINEKLSKVRQQ